MIILIKIINNLTRFIGLNVDFSFDSTFRAVTAERNTIQKKKIENVFTHIRFTIYIVRAYSIHLWFKKKNNYTAYKIFTQVPKICSMTIFCTQVQIVPCLNFKFNEAVFYSSTL